MSRVAALRLLARDWGLRKFDELTLDVRGMSPSHGALVVAGYASTLSLIGAGLLSTFFPESLVFLDTADAPARISNFSFLVATAAFVIGWAFLLTGASDSRRWVFLAILVIWLFQALLLAGLIDPVFGITVLVAGLGVVVVGGLTAHSPAWRRRPIAEFLGWLTLSVAVVGVGCALTEDVSALARAMYVIQEYLALFALPIWIWLGFDAVLGGIDLARVALKGVRRLLVGSAFRIVSALVIVALPIGLASVLLVPGLPAAVTSWLAWAVVITPPLSLLCLGLVVLGRWREHVAMLILSLAFALLALTFAHAQALHSTGLESALGVSALIPPLGLVMLLITYDLLALGTRHAEIDGRVLPRTGRVLMYFGTLLLILGSSMMLLSVQYPERSAGLEVDLVQAFMGFGLIVGIVIVGLPYLIFTAIRRSDRLTGAGGVGDGAISTDNSRPSSA